MITRSKLSVVKNTDLTSSRSGQDTFSSKYFIHEQNCKTTEQGKHATTLSLGFVSIRACTFVSILSLTTTVPITK